MNVGDRVELSEQGRGVYLDGVRKFTGEVVEIEPPWLKVLWDKAPDHVCKECNGKGVVKLLWTVHEEHLRKK